MMTTLFFFGLISGSFINAFLWRYKKGITHFGRSMCPDCKEMIAWYDNIPLISYLFLRGKCRKCKKRISLRYPTIELITGIAFLLVGILTESGRNLSGLVSAGLRAGEFALTWSLAQSLLEVVLLCAVSAMLIIIAAYDLETKEIPNSFNIAFIVLSASFIITANIMPSNFSEIINHLLAAIVAFLFFFSLAYFSKETWMGGGDGKMAFGIGLLLGPLNTFLAILIASVVGSVFGIAKLSRARNRKKSTRADHEIPFGPFLAIGTYVSLIFGPQIISWYVRIFLGI